MDATLTTRRFLSSFPAQIPKHWIPGNPVLSAMLNTYTLLVPANESFYIRTLKRYLPRIDDPALRLEVVAFIHQEAQHGVAHKRYWNNLHDQGYRFRWFEASVDWLAFRLIGRLLPLSLRMSSVSAIEHVNAYLGHEFLSQHILADADPRMRALMHWHFAEEIEHKAVAFDALKAISPGYVVRLLGFMASVPLFYVFMSIGTLYLLAQDGLLLKRATWRQFRCHLWSTHRIIPKTFAHLFAYLRPGFHPSQLDDRVLAQRVIDELTESIPPSIVPTLSAKRDQAGVPKPGVG